MPPRRDYRVDRTAIKKLHQFNGVRAEDLGLEVRIG
jgi:hypothetical protein